MPGKNGYEQRMPLPVRVVTVTFAWSLSAMAAGQTVPRLAGDFERLWRAPAGRSLLEGPAYDGVGAVWFTNLKDLSPNTPTDILRFDIATGSTTVMVEDSGGANGLAFDQEGRLSRRFGTTAV